MREMMQFNRASSTDEGLRWLRERLREAGEVPD